MELLDLDIKLDQDIENNIILILAVFGYWNTTLGGRMCISAMEDTVTIPSPQLRALFEVVRHYGATPQGCTESEIRKSCVHFLAGIAVADSEILYDAVNYLTKFREVYND